MKLFINLVEHKYSYVINAYIEFYNNEGYQERLYGLNPLEFRTQAA